MTFLPVIGRELRSSSRHAFTYHLRTIGAGVVILVCFVFGLDEGFSPSMGKQLFATLHFTLFWAIWVLAPLLTADCISRERREGTLGLLFLTHLKSPDIVVAKGVAHGMRAMTLWVAVVPIVTIPFLMGGVGWTDVALSTLVNLSAICWALAAGLLASASNKSWLRSILMAEILAVFFVILFSTCAGGLLFPTVSARRSGIAWDDSIGLNLLYMTMLGLGFLTNATDAWSKYFLRLTTSNQLLTVMGEVALLSLIALAVVIMIAGARTRRVWQELPPSKSQAWVQKTFLTPVIWLSFFRRWMRRKLERNPVGWLEQRTWTGRLVTWGWFAVVISLYSALLEDRNFFRKSEGLHIGMAWLLAGSMAMSAAGSFRRERESGVLELLLVSPMGERQIIAGRLRGLWGQFLPSFGLLLAAWTYVSFRPFDEPIELGPRGFFATTFFALPLVGLYFSLRCRNYLAGLLATFGVGLVFPLIFVALAVWFYRATIVSMAYSSHRFQLSLSAAAVQLLVASFCWSRLYHSLKNRSFPLDRTDG
jgi:ABC-type transport system involved in cytochrome c biogenesis permease component